MFEARILLENSPKISLTVIVIKNSQGSQNSAASWPMTLVFDSKNFALFQIFSRISEKQKVYVDFLLSLATSCAALGGSWVLDFHH